MLLELLKQADIQSNPVSHINDNVINDDVIACIHHPSADVKKISLDNDGLQSANKEGSLDVEGDFWLVSQWG